MSTTVSTFLGIFLMKRFFVSAFNRPNSFYQLLYAMLGISVAIFTFLLCVLHLLSELCGDFGSRSVRS